MARESQDREDLLAEATALVERVELVMPDEPQPVMAGFRRDGCLSLFFGPDPVYQFNTQHALRRAYAAKRLYKAENGQLVALDRRREAGVLQLLRHELDEAETEQFLREMTARLTRLSCTLSDGSYAVAGQVPADAPIAARVQDWLATHAAGISIAASPRAK